jgi:mannose/cellobiose epimerase-like protein (N-acyl-D-glucosamine 2-epimerase family)
VLDDDNRRDHDHNHLAHYATRYRRRLAETIMPYWHDVTRDDAYGGYLVHSDFQRAAPLRIARRVLARSSRAATRNKQLVSQSRLVWLFSYAHHRALGRSGVDYRSTAERGDRFLLEHFLDRDHGGFRWMTDRAGWPVNNIKSLYGQAFLIYAFTEFARAAGDRGALQHALDLHGVVNARLRDTEHGGWFEHATPDWCVLRADDGLAVVEVAGLKSANAHLHWLEALAELYDATGDEDVRRSLLEARLINTRYFFPRDAGRSCQHRHHDWSAIDSATSNALSYGHNVQFAWMLIRAEAVLGVAPSWEVFYAHLDHALRYGYDHRRGGAYRLGFDDQLATRTEKLWWVQAELAVALTDALLHKWERRYSRALVQTLRFVERHQTDRADGVWVELVTAAGRRDVPRKAGPWKVGYHEVRSLARLVDAFAASA